VLELDHQAHVVVVHHVLPRVPQLSPRLPCWLSQSENGAAWRPLGSPLPSRPFRAGRSRRLRSPRPSESTRLRTPLASGADYRYQRRACCRGDL